MHPVHEADAVVGYATTVDNAHHVRSLLLDTASIAASSAVDVDHEAIAVDVVGRRGFLARINWRHSVAVVALLGVALEFVVVANAFAVA